MMCQRIFVEEPTKSTLRAFKVGNLSEITTVKNPLETPSMTNFLKPILITCLGKPSFILVLTY